MLLDETCAGQAPDKKTVVIFFGMTASGKSTLGKAWANRCRATYYNTDRVRKQLAGLQASDKRPDAVGRGIYAPDFTERTYQVLVDSARENFRQGARSVVLDGSYSKRMDRDRVREMAAEVGARCIFVFCVCSESEVRRRLALRTSDPEAVSDGRWEIYLHQQQTFEVPDARSENDCLLLDTEQTVEAMVSWFAAQSCLQL